MGTAPLLSRLACSIFPFQGISSPPPPPPPLLAHPFPFWGIHSPPPPLFIPPPPLFTLPPSFYTHPGADKEQMRGYKSQSEALLAPSRGGEHGPRWGAQTPTHPPPNPSTDPTLGLDTKTHRETWNNLTPRAVWIWGAAPRAPHRGCSCCGGRGCTTSSHSAPTPSKG